MTDMPASDSRFTPHFQTKFVDTVAERYVLTEILQWAEARFEMHLDLFQNVHGDKDASESAPSDFERVFRIVCKTLDSVQFVTLFEDARSEPWSAGVVDTRDEFFARIEQIIQNRGLEYHVRINPENVCEILVDGFARQSVSCDIYQSPRLYADFMFDVVIFEFRLKID